jgi:catechol 2,3-dioxygenase-like lactoylglutathione lyase family enzyme
MLQPSEEVSAFFRCGRSSLSTLTCPTVSAASCDIAQGCHARTPVARHDANPGDGFSEFRTGLDHLEFLVPRREDLHEWAGRLDDLGVPHSGVKAPGYTPNAMVTFRDTDNIQLEFFWRAPAELGT